MRVVTTRHAIVAAAIIVDSMNRRGHVRITSPLA
jgi:hypothetical protein